MGIVVRQSFKATIISYLGAILGYCNIVFITPLCLSPEIVGFNKIFLDTGLLFTFLAQLGLNSAMVRFFPFFKDGKTNKGFFFFIAVIPLIGFALLSIGVIFGYQYFTGFFVANSKIFADNFLSRH